MGWTPFLTGLLLIPFVSGYNRIYFFLCKTIYIIQMFLLIAQPLLLTFLMDFFEPCSTMPIWYAWLLAIACVLTAVCSSVLMHHVNYNFYRKTKIYDHVILVFLLCSNAWLKNACCL